MEDLWRRELRPELDLESALSDPVGHSIHKLRLEVLVKIMELPLFHFVPTVIANFEATGDHYSYVLTELNEAYFLGKRVNFDGF